MFLLAIAFSLKSLREPDLWWQIRTGEWILENGQIPKQDIFSYTFSGAEWVNVKWGSEVLYALLTKAAGPECVFLLQALVACLLVFTLLRLSKAFSPAQETFSWPAVLAVLFTLIASEYRINGRPEMFSHLFTVVFLWLLLQHRKNPSFKILWLIPLQIVWANMHEAFGIGIVLVAIFFVGDWIEYLLNKRGILKSTIQLPKELSVLLIGVIVAVIVNPNGVTLLTKPLNILGQVYENKYTTELFDFTTPDYWQWNIYLAIALLVITKVGWYLFFLKAPKSKRYSTVLQHTGISYLLAALAFFYLASTAYRNVIFFVLLLLPALAFAVKELSNKAKWLQKHTLQVTAGVSVFILVLYVLVVSNKYYELTNSRDRFGLEVLSTYNPTGAANFIKANNIKGKCFSDYLTSSCLLWKLQPEFNTFIDLRDLDVFPAPFFSTFAEAVTFPESFKRLDSAYNFSYVVLYRPQFAALHRYLYTDSTYSLAFVDPVAAVYVKHAPAKDVAFTTASPVAVSGLANVVNHIFNPLYKPYNYAETNYDYLAASYYSTIGETAKAEANAQKAATGKTEAYKGKEMLGEIYYNKALATTNADEKAQLLYNAASYYQQSINEEPTFSPAHLGLGAVYFQQQNYQMALANFENAIKADKTNLNAYIFAAECCKYYINFNNAESKTYIERAIAYYKKADALNPDNPNIMLNMGFLYFRINDCKNATGYLSKVVNYEGLNPTEKQQAKDCLQKCGS